MNGLPVTIRLLDPPLHEFLPNPNELVNRINKLKNIKHVEEIENAKVMLEAARDLNEVNPMMGHRGVRLGITYPEIYEMQIRAVFEATAKLIKMKINAKPTNNDSSSKR